MRSTNCAKFGTVKLDHVRNKSGFNFRSTCKEPAIIDAKDERALDIKNDEQRQLNK